MRSYVLWNYSEKKYVANAGERSSFTHDVTKARRFNSFADAKSNVCGNETVQGFDGFERVALNYGPFNPR